MRVSSGLKITCTRQSFRVRECEADTSTGLVDV